MSRICCARLRGNTPERRSPELGLRARTAGSRPLACIALLAFALAGSSCSGSARAVRLPVPPGSPDLFRVSCDKRISACREKAEQVCGGSYEVLETTGASIEPERVQSSGPRYTGPRYQRAKWLGRMVIACGKAPALTATDASFAKSADSPALGARQPSVLGAEQLCIPGVTLECLGPGACRGAQVCLADGRGYGSCDCGTSAPESSGSLSAPHADAGTAH
jgi:hypothetical protein